MILAEIFSSQDCVALFSMRLRKEEHFSLYNPWLLLMVFTRNYSKTRIFCYLVNKVWCFISNYHVYGHFSTSFFHLPPLTMVNLVLFV